ncbi:diaminopimelate epimerase [Salinibacter grassmerensis]|uniref:diaminopimelate epimerase n=1 Tax=Salinibacter grassmerensis TaxID=3040353 RepID=UPI0021E8543C|nr:diaminopimelate epimerase [Salinibacter grassmerensis]
MVSFTKMHGTGNDFIVFDNRSPQLSPDELSACAAAWCPRRYGVGADGLLALDAPETSTADYRMHYVNADGSRATMCGNGARCLFRFARRVGFQNDPLAFDTDAGLYRATAASGEEPAGVRLFVPDVTDFRAGVVLERSVPQAVETLCFAHAGTEHLVAVVDDLEAVPVSRWGRRLRRDPSLAPAGANVNFVELGHEEDLGLRTYEKGVEAETPSCGTGVLAAAETAGRLLKTDPDVTLQVNTPGGKLSVGRTEEGTLYLQGPAVSVFDGHIERPEDEA